MPIYEYECQKCGEMTEAMQNFSDRPLVKCEKCKGKLRKLISQNSFHLKGAGWYATDYASKTGTLKSNTKTSEENKTKPVEAKTAAGTENKKTPHE
jgi:putative FmdB family regulatory protein